MGDTTVLVSALCCDLPSIGDHQICVLLWQTEPNVVRPCTVGMLIVGMACSGVPIRTEEQCKHGEIIGTYLLNDT